LSIYFLATNIAIYRKKKAKGFSVLINKEANWSLLHTSKIYHVKSI